MTPIITPMSGAPSLGTVSSELMREISLLRQEIKRQQLLLDGDDEEASGVQ